MEVGKDEKYCAKCEKVLPLAAFRMSKGKLKDRDTYCKGCRRLDAVKNRERENARWTKYRKDKASQGIILGQERRKKNARSAALRAHPNPGRCLVCPNRGERHHHLGYDKAHETDVIYLCRHHHALEHILEKARTASEPTYL